LFVGEAGASSLDCEQRLFFLVGPFRMKFQ
jgi:hypothetical protein